MESEEDKKTILIVDDDANMVKTVQILLELNEYKIITAYDGSKALEKVVSEKPDLIVLDIDIPELDGYEVLERIKENPALRNIPVIMLTAKSSGADFDRAMEMKADWYIAKPFESMHLVDKIRSLI